MKKQEVKKTLVSNCLYELDGYTLREAAAYLIECSESYEAQGWVDITFDTDTDYDNDTVLMINGSRLETDDEAIARAVKEVRIEKTTRKHDLKVFKATAARLGINIDNIKEL